MYLQVQRPIWSLSISDSILTKLRNAGYEYLEDLSNGQNNQELKQLAPELSVDIFTNSSVPVSQTSLELYKIDRKENGNIVTFSKALDELLGGGIRTSEMTELVGAPGSGKTQICFQLCVSVQIPGFLGCLSGSAVYVGTNNNFSERRIREIYTGVVQHCLTITENETLSDEDKSAFCKFMATDPLLGIKKYSIGTVEELRASAFVIENVLEESKNVRLIIIDSFTFPFYATDSNLERTKIISGILNHFNELAALHRIAVVITNELTTCILGNERKEIVPSLGETFAHVIHNRVLLGQEKSSTIHTALLQKSAEFPLGSAYFQITNEGIRDIPTN